MLSTEETFFEDDDFDFAEVMSPEYTPRPRALGFCQPRARTGRARLADNGALFESDERAADRENGRAW